MKGRKAIEKKFNSKLSFYLFFISFPSENKNLEFSDASSIFRFSRKDRKGSDYWSEEFELEIIVRIYLSIF